MAVEPARDPGPDDGLRPDDAERELAQLAADGGPLRRQLARIAGRLVATGAWDRLGFARLGDYGRERLGLSERELHELARVDRALADLPRIEASLCSGELGWTKVRLLCRVATASDEASWLALAGVVSARELARRVRAVEREAHDAADAHRAYECAGEDGDTDEQPARLRIACADHVPMKWGDVRRLVRRVAGEWLPFPVCAEYVAAEVISALPPEVDPQGSEASSARERAAAVATPRTARASSSPFVEALGEDLEQADAFELDRRSQRAVALERGLLSRMGPRLAEVADGRLFRDLGLSSLDAYAHERLGMSPRKARGLLRVERACRRSPELREAWTSGAISWSQAQTLVAVVVAPGSEPWQERWITRAGAVSVRRLEDDVDRALASGNLDPVALPPLPEPIALDRTDPAGVQTGARLSPAKPTRYVTVCASPEVVRLFRVGLATVRLRLERLSGRPASPGEALEAMLDHVLLVWRQGERALSPSERRASAVFERDAWRCTIPGCRSYRNLHAHHIRFRSRGGSDALENLTTLCAAHHQRGVHGGRIRIEGSAPDRLRFELPLGRWRSGDLREEPAGTTPSADRSRDLAVPASPAE
jgi:hypothetical protein